MAYIPKSKIAWMKTQSRHKLKKVFETYRYLLNK